MLCLHCSPPTSDPRAPEQREPHSLLTDINWAPRGLQRLSGNRWPPPGSSPKATKGSPAHPEDPRTETPAQQAQPPRLPRCACNDRAAHTSRRTRRAILTPASRAESDPQRDNHAHTRQPATTTAPPETPAATLRYLTICGEGLPALNRNPHCSDGHDRASHS